MHGTVCNENERSRDYSKSNHVVPIGQGVETKSAQDRGTRHLDVQTILVINQGKVGHFIDNQGFKSIVEDRQLSRVVSTCIA